MRNKQSSAIQEKPGARANFKWLLANPNAINAAKRVSPK